jgi:O-antigen ligase
LGFLHTGAQDITVSFNVVSLFTMVLFKEALNLLDQHSEDILVLFCHIMASSYFSTTGQFCKQTNGMAMGLLVTTIFFMEDF